MRHLRFQVVLLLILSMFLAASSWGAEFCVDSAGTLQHRSDDFAWNGQWITAESVFHQAMIRYFAERSWSKALYLQVSQITPQAAVTARWTLE